MLKYNVKKLKSTLKEVYNGWMDKVDYRLEKSDVVIEVYCYAELFMNLFELWIILKMKFKIKYEKKKFKMKRRLLIIVKKLVWKLYFFKFNGNVIFLKFYDFVFFRIYIWLCVYKKLEELE